MRPQGVSSCLQLRWLNSRSPAYMLCFLQLYPRRAQAGRLYQAPHFRPTPPLGVDGRGAPLAFDFDLAASAASAAAAARAAGAAELADAAQAIAEDAAFAARRIQENGGAAALGLLGGGEDVLLEGIPGLAPPDSDVGPFEGYSHRWALRRCG